MTVVVKFHGSASPSLAAWRRRLLAMPPHDPAMAHVLIDEMVRWFQKYDGVPPDTVVANQPTPRHVAKFSADTWVHFQIKKTGTGRVRSVIVLGVTDSPP